MTTTSLYRHIRLNLQHHDRPSLFAGKLHAILQRAYPKGRDIYDLWWYLSQPAWPEPNLTQLNEALVQSGWTRSVLNSGNWRSFVRERVEQLDWQEDVLRDIQAFIITSDWEEHLNKDSLLNLLAP